MTDFNLKLTYTEIDESLDNARTPTSHAASHKSGGSDAIKLSELAAADNVTTLNATTSHPGLLPILSGVSTEFLDGTGAFSTPAGGSGTDITYPGSSTVFLNGNGGFTVPSASGSVFRPCITIGPTGSGANYECDGVADHIQFQAAINAVASGGEIQVLHGTYSITSTVVKQDKNIVIKGIGTPTINLSTSGDYGFSFYGTAAAAANTLASTAVEGNNYIVVSSATGFAAGQNIIIYDNTSWEDYGDEYNGLLTGEMHEIFSISGTTIYLHDVLQRSYTTGNSSAAKSFSSVSVKFDGINFVGPSSKGTQIAIAIKYGNGVNVQNCKFKDCGGGGVYMYTCYDANITNNSILDCNKDGLGYGVGCSTACAKIRISNNQISGCRHCVSVTSDLKQPGCDRDIIITHNIFHSEQTGAVDAHPVLMNWVVSNNIFYAEVDGETVINSITDGSQRAIITDNECYNGNFIRPRDTMNYYRNKTISGNIVYGGYLYYDVQAVNYNNLLISDNTCIGAPLNAIYVYSPTSGTIKKNATSIKIINNTIEDATGIAIRVPWEAALAATSIDISGNTISGCTEEAIYLYVKSEYDNDVIISRNIIRGANSSDATLAAIKVYGVIGGIVSGNRVNDPNGHNGAGIVLSTGCTDNVVVENVVKGMTGTKISLAGTGNISEHNQELA